MRMFSLLEATMLLVDGVAAGMWLEHEPWFGVLLLVLPVAVLVSVPLFERARN